VSENLDKEIAPVIEGIAKLDKQKFATAIDAFFRCSPRSNGFVMYNFLLSHSSFQDDFLDKATLCFGLMGEQSYKDEFSQKLRPTKIKANDGTFFIQPDEGDRRSSMTKICDFGSRKKERHSTRHN
jgi:hypothetical protein